MREHPGNYYGAAKFLGWTRNYVQMMVAEFQDEFQELEEGHLDQLEEYVHLYALGRSLPEDVKNFSYTSALQLLERKRPATWIKGKTKEKKFPRRFQRDFARQRLEEHENGRPSTESKQPVTIRIKDT